MSATVQYRREGNTQHWSVCARVQDRYGIATSLGFRWLLSHMKKIQTLLGVSETNKPTSLHNEEKKVRRHTCYSCRMAALSADTFSNGVSSTPKTNKQQSMHKADTLSIHVHSPSLRYHRALTRPPLRLQNVDHSLPLSGSPGMASRIVSQVFSAPVT